MFCLETGWKDEEDDVEAREAGCSIVATDMVLPDRGFPLLDLREGTSREIEVIYAEFNCSCSQPTRRGDSFRVSGSRRIHQWKGWLIEGDQTSGGVNLGYDS